MVVREPRPDYPLDGYPTPAVRPATTCACRRDGREAAWGELAVSDPALVVQQILNALAVRQIQPKGVERTDLVWTVLGFTDDDDLHFAFREPHQLVIEELIAGGVRPLFASA